MAFGRWVAATLAAAVWWWAPERDATAGTAHEREHRCLALALYWEAKAEGQHGMLAVASVVLNRVAHREFPDTVCAVVKQGGELPPCQFSWWCDGKSDRPTEVAAWRLAREIADHVLLAPPPDPTGGALFFHNVGIAEPWRIERTRTARIGRHIFYR